MQIASQLIISPVINESPNWKRHFVPIIRVDEETVVAVCGQSRARQT